jgi:nucleoid DNA-binding protein
MNELVQLVMQKTGLPQDKAQEVVDTVVNHLKARLPESLLSHLSTFLGSIEAGDSTAGLTDKAKSVVAGFGGMFGTKAD